MKIKVFFNKIKKIYQKTLKNKLTIFKIKKALINKNILKEFKKVKNKNSNLVIKKILDLLEINLNKWMMKKINI